MFIDTKFDGRTYQESGEQWDKSTKLDQESEWFQGNCFLDLLFIVSCHKLRCMFGESAQKTAQNQRKIDWQKGSYSYYLLSNIFARTPNSYYNTTNLKWHRVRYSHYELFMYDWRIEAGRDGYEYEFRHYRERDSTSLHSFYRDLCLLFVVSIFKLVHVATSTVWLILCRTSCFK